MKQKIKQELQEKRGEIESAIVKPIFRTSTNYRRFPKVIPELDKTRITESSGYITAKQRIENMILAGQRLVAYRKEQFDFHEDQQFDENYNDPTRRKNYDMADAFQDGLVADQVQKDFKKEVQKQKETKEKEIPKDTQKEETE